MYSFKTYIIEMKDPKSKTLHAFDMDETLFAHDHDKLKVHVNDPTGKRVSSLTNQEYNRYTLPSGHSFDYSDFKSSSVFQKSARPIRKMIGKLKGIHKNNKNVEILTARSDLDDQPAFAKHMKKFGIDIGQIHVRRAGNLSIPNTGAAKAEVVSGLIKKHGYTKIHLYDDHPGNLEHFLKLKEQHPTVQFHAHHIQHDPSTGHVTVTTKVV